MRQGYNLYVDKTYSDTILKNLEEKVLEKGMLFDFPQLDSNIQMKKNKLIGSDKNQLTLTNL